MIKVTTPLRISLLGGGLDYQSWLKNHDGQVIGGAIQQYSHILLRETPKFLPFKTKLVYSETEIVQDNRDIQHKVIKACLEFFDLMDKGFEIFYLIDVPGRSGLGSSSSFTVSLLNALYHFKYNRKYDPEMLAIDTIYIEQEILKENVGKQDQVWSAYGGVNQIWFGEKFFHVYPAYANIEALEKHSLLFFTNINRTANTVAATYADKLGDKEYKQRMWGLVALAKNGHKDLMNGNWRALGEKIGESWDIKKSLSPIVTNPTIDGLYDKAMLAGAYGGKLLGAGNGGCLYFLAPPNKHQDIKNALNNLVEIPVKFDMGGSRIG